MAENKKLMLCKNCNHFWDGTITPFCPNCMKNKCLNSPNILRRKHNPLALPLRWKSFRTVVTTDFVHNQEDFFTEIANTGTYFFNPAFKTYTCFCDTPLGMIGGSAVPKGYDMPTHPVGGAIIIDFPNNPHIFAEDPIVIAQYISGSNLVPSQLCTSKDCFFLSVPGSSYCLNHGPNEMWSILK